MLDPVSILRHVDMDATPLRIEMLQAMATADRPIPAKALLEAVRLRQPINKVTLYRNLDLFVEKGLVDKVHPGEKDKAARYCVRPRRATGPHGHFYCTRCGEMECLNESCLMEAISTCGRSFQHRIDHVELRLEGICKHCLDS